MLCINYTDNRDTTKCTIMPLHCAILGTECMHRRINYETKLGGLFGIIAVIAICVEMYMDGFSSRVLVSGIKDIAGTLVGVAVFVIAARSLIPKREKLTYEEKLQRALDQWKASHKPMISKFDVTKNGDIRYFMLTDPIRFFQVSSDSDIVGWESGWFVRMPAIVKENYVFADGNGKQVILKFHLNKGTFFEGQSNDEAEVGYGKLINLFTPFIISRYPNLIEASGDLKSHEITVCFKTAIETDEQIAQFISVLDTMAQLYMIAANMNFGNK